MARLLLLTALVMSPIGCGTMENLRSRQEPDHGQVYGGVRRDVAMVRGDVVIAHGAQDPRSASAAWRMNRLFGALAAIDMVLSTATDTATLPYTIWVSTQREMLTEVPPAPTTVAKNTKVKKPRQVAREIPPAASTPAPPAAVPNVTSAKTTPANPIQVVKATVVEPKPAPAAPEMSAEEKRREVERIINGAAPDDEKAAALKRLVKVGDSQKDVEKVLGDFACERDGFGPGFFRNVYGMADQPGLNVTYYPDRTVCLVEYRAVKIITVDHDGDMDWPKAPAAKTPDKPAAK